MRVLTKKFTAYTVAQCEKQYKKDFLDFIDIGNLSFSKMITLVQMGNGYFNGKLAMGEEEAAGLIDKYLSSNEDHTIVDVFIQLLEEIDMDTKLFKGSGTSVEDIRENLIKKNNNITSFEEFKQEQQEAEEVADNITPIAPVAPVVNNETNNF